MLGHETLDAFKQRDNDGVIRLIIDILRKLGDRRGQDQLALILEARGLWYDPDFGQLRAAQTNEELAQRLTDILKACGDNRGCDTLTLLFTGVIREQFDARFRSGELQLVPA